MIAFIKTLQNAVIACATVFTLVSMPLVAVAADLPPTGGYYADTSYIDTSSQGYYADTSYADSNDGYYADTSYSDYTGGYYADTSYSNPPTYTPPTYTPPSYNPPAYNPPASVIPSCTLTASKTSITKGENVKLTWTSSKAKYATLSTVGSVNVSGNRTVTPDYTTTYILTVTSKDGNQKDCSTTITVTTPAPTCTLTADRTSINRGENVTLSWSTTNAQTVRLTSFPNEMDKNGSKSVNPQDTTTYTLTVYGTNGQTVDCSKTVTVNIPNPGPTCTLNVNPSAITHPGQAVTITWNSNNTTGGYINGVGNVSSNGSTTVYPQGNTTYTGTFYGTNGQQVNCSGVVNINPVTNPGPSCTIIINNNAYNNNNYTANQAVTIAWTSYNANTGWINNNVGAVTLNGSRTVYPTQTTTYTATFTGYNGQTVNCSVTVYINGYVPPTTPYITLSSVPYTGLDLGPVGTAVYWGFLVFWALFAAYLIVVKRIQNGIYASAKSLLFGKDEVAVAHAAHTDVISRGLFSTADLEVIANTLRAVIEGPAKENHVAHATPVAAAPAGDVIDEFVLSQIHRTRHN